LRYILTFIVKIGGFYAHVKQYIAIVSIYPAHCEKIPFLSENYKWVKEEKINIVFFLNLCKNTAMGVVFKFFMPFILLFCIQTVYGIDLTKKEIETYLIGEYNRSFDYNIGIEAAGGIELNNICNFRSGVLYKKGADSSDINSFLGGKYSPFSKIPLSFSFLYIYNGLPEYKTNSHSILPFISLNTKYAGVSIGPNFKFTSFLDETAIFEFIISSLIYFNFINNETLRIGISAGNFSEFFTRNIGAYSIRANAEIRLNDNLLLINELEFLQSGADGLTSTFFGLALHGGVKFTW